MTKGRQASDERLYLKVEDGRCTCYIAYQNSPWIEAAWESEPAKDGKLSAEM